MTREKIDWMSICEVAAYVQFSEMTVRRWVAAGSITHYKIGKSVRIKRQDVDGFINSRLVKKKRGGK